MKISRENIDALNAVLRIDIAEADYAEKVEKTLESLRKKADVPGFRKGMVPAGIIKKQYGTSVLVEEVNKIIQAQMDKYMQDENLSIFGQPLPRESKQVDWENDKDFSFEFEIGLIPEVKVDLTSAAKKVTAYKIKPSAEYIDEHITSLTKRFGKIEDVEKVEKNSDVVVKIEARDENGELSQPGAYPKGIVVVSDIKNSKNFVGKKVGDVVEISTKDFKSSTRLSQFLGKSADECEGFDATLVLTIEKISNVTPAELNTELFDKLYGEGVVADADALRTKIEGEAEAAFAGETDSQLLNDTVDFLIEDTKFDLPLDFLKRWVMLSGEKKLTEEEALREIESSQKGLRYQLIEAQILMDHNAGVDYTQITDKAKELIQAQMAQYGRFDIPETELEDIVKRVLQNREEVSRLQAMIIREKLMDIFKSEIKYKTKEVSLDDFVKAIAKKK